MAIQATPKNPNPSAVWRVLSLLRIVGTDGVTVLAAVFTVLRPDDPAVEELWGPAEEVGADCRTEAMIRIPSRNREKYIEQLEMKLKQWQAELHPQTQMSCYQHWLYELEAIPSRVKNTADSCSNLSGSCLICCITGC